MVSTAGERRRREVGTRQEIPKVEHVGAVSIDVPGGRAQEASPSLGVGARMPNHKRAIYITGGKTTEGDARRP
ncbi:MAG TPA: hypothetical protein VIR30_16895 [Nocardioides sp.]